MRKIHYFLLLIMLTSFNVSAQSDQQPTNATNPLSNILIWKNQNDTTTRELYTSLGYSGGIPRFERIPRYHDLQFKFLSKMDSVALLATRYWVTHSNNTYNGTQTFNIVNAAQINSTYGQYGNLDIGIPGGNGLQLTNGVVAHFYSPDTFSQSTIYQSNDTSLNIATNGGANTTQFKNNNIYDKFGIRYLKTGDVPTAAQSNHYADSLKKQILTGNNIYTGSNNFTAQPQLFGVINFQNGYIRGDAPENLALHLGARNGLQISGITGTQIASLNDLNPFADNPGIEFFMPVSIPKTNNSTAVTISNPSGNSYLYMGANSLSITDEGTPSVISSVFKDYWQFTNNNKQGKLYPPTLTDNRTWNLPDTSGTIALVGGSGGTLPVGDTVVFARKTAINAKVDTTRFRTSPDSTNLFGGIIAPSSPGGHNNIFFRSKYISDVTYRNDGNTVIGAGTAPKLTTAREITAMGSNTLGQYTGTGNGIEDGIISAFGTNVFSRLPGINLEGGANQNNEGFGQKAATQATSALGSTIIGTHSANSASKLVETVIMGHANGGSASRGDGFNDTLTNVTSIGSSGLGGVGNKQGVVNIGFGASQFATGLDYSTITGSFSFQNGKGTHHAIFGSGSSPNLTGDGNTNIGDITATGSNTQSNSINIGRGAGNNESVSNIMTAGSTLYPVNAVYFGKGRTAALPTDYTISGTASTAANTSGGSIFIQAGSGRGPNGNKGSVYIGTPDNVTGSSTQQPVTNKVAFTRLGNIIAGFNAETLSDGGAKFQTQGTATAGTTGRSISTSLIHAPTANNQTIVANVFQDTFVAGTGALTSTASGTTTAADGTVTAQATVTLTGTGSGATYTVTTVSNSATIVTMVVAGIGYAIGDTFTIASLPGITFTVASLGYTSSASIIAQFNNAPVRLGTIIAPTTSGTGDTYSTGADLFFKTSSRLANLSTPTVVGTLTAGIWNATAITSQYLTFAPGSASFTTNGSTTSFNVTYTSPGFTPIAVSWMPSSAIGASGWYITSLTSTGFTVNYVTAPVTGTATAKYTLIK
ncbi:hypothetical protein SAMN05216464_110200 [Mucilaginibacter pineti]|uniref:Uncharacterized protein n=1 Tax=Mucilaginibacter pineti TaxID=1391627 RepID=A0A1G7GLU2_9SPHI|nr:hypothetical protein [Mucilaginibacter pineti]SDE88949.1 hypothetical protein SAMN05216464_110200 [Mucilaginibacter pineti]